MGNVRSLHEATSGISPEIRNASTELRETIEQAIKAANNRGMPNGLIVGLLELIKFDLISTI